MPHDSTDIVRLLPLSPAVFHILLALADDDRHGYAIMRDIEDGPTGSCGGPGMLYGSVKWLLKDGLMKRRRRGPARAPTTPARLPLTAPGRALLKAEAARLEAAAVSPARDRSWRERCDANGRANHSTADDAVHAVAPSRIRRGHRPRGLRSWRRHRGLRRRAGSSCISSAIS